MGGQLAAFWPGYDLYETIDNVYSMKAWENKLGFPLAQATMNIVENVFNFTYLYLSHSSDENKRAASPVVGLIGVTMTCSKTVLYFLCDYYCGFCESGHNSWSRWLFMYLVSLVQQYPQSSADIVLTLRWRLFPFWRRP